MRTISLDGLTNMTVRATSTGNISTDNGLRYLVVQNMAGPNEVYSDNGVALTDLGPMPQQPGTQAAHNIYDGNGHCGPSCQAVSFFGIGAGHAGICSIGGIPGWCTIMLRQAPSYALLYFMRFSAGVDKMTIDEAAGRGATMLYYIDHQTADVHIGMARFGDYI